MTVGMVILKDILERMTNAWSPQEIFSQKVFHLCFFSNFGTFYIVATDSGFGSSHN